MDPYTEQPSAGHNESAVRLAALAGDAQIALDKVAKGEADAIDGWLAYGAALNEGRALFPSDEQFGQWVREIGVCQLATHEIDRHERAAAMWAAANADQLAEARAASKARTLRGWHDQWKKIESEREKARRKAEQEAEETRKRAEADAARQEAKAQAEAEASARAAAEAAKTAEDRQAAEAEAERAAKAQAEAEQTAQDIEAAITPPEPEIDPAEAKARREIARLTDEGKADEIIGLRADLAETKAKLKQARSEIVRLKELNASFTGDSAEVIRRMSREIEHKNSEMFRAKEDTAAAMRQVYKLKQENKRLQDELGNQMVPL